MSRMLTVGDSIGIAYRVCKRDLKFLIGILMTPTIFYTAGKLGFLWSLHEYALLRSHHAGFSEMASFFSITAGFFISSIVSYTALFWLIFRQLAYVRMIVYEKEDYKAELDEVSKHRWKIVTFFIGSFVFLMFAMVFVIVVFVALVMLLKMMHLPNFVSGSISLVVSIIGVAFVFLLFIPMYLYVLIMVMEGGGFFGTIGRSFEISFKNLGKLIGFGFLGYAAFTLVGFCLQAPYQLYYLFHYAMSASGGPDNLSKSPLLAVPLYLQMLAGTWQSVIFMYIYPAFWLGAGYVYNTIRMKEDGIDLMRDIERLELKQS